MTRERRAVVVGGGVTGLLVGLALRDAGWEVLVLEAHHVGAGSSSRSAAGIRQQFAQAATVRAMRHAVAAYRALGERFGTPLLAPQGYLFLLDASQLDEADARVAVQREAGLVDVERLDGDEVRRRFPWVGPGMAGATWCPSDGFLRADAVLGEAARALREAGGQLRVGAPVVSAEREGPRLTALRTADGERLGADLFVDATNAWTRRTARALGLTDLPVDPLKRHLWWLRTGTALPPAVVGGFPLVVLPSGVYARPEGHAGLLVGWARPTPSEPVFTLDDQDRVDPAHAHDGGLETVPLEAWTRLAEAVPALSDAAGFAATTCGYYGTTPDHHPFLGYDPSATNVLRLVGFSGHGLMMAPFTAAAAVALAEAGGPVDIVRLPTGDVPLAPFGLDRARSGGAHAERMVI